MNNLCSLDSMPSLVHFQICHFLSGSDIINMSMLNRKWYSIISKNRHMLAKKHTTLHMCRNKKEGTQLMMNIEQKGYSCYYGVRLKKFKERWNNRYKKADYIDVTDINDISMENQFDMPTKWIEDVDSGIKQLISVITAKVDFKWLSLADVNADDLRFFSQCFSEYRTRVGDITVFFAENQHPQEVVDILDSIRTCRQVKIHCSRGRVLPVGLLETKAIRESRIIDIDMEDWRLEPSLTQEPAENHDEQIASLSAESIRIRGTRLTAQGANSLITQWQMGQREIKQWQSGQRNISGNPGIEISTDISKFDEKSVLKGVQDYQREPSSLNYFLVGRIADGKRQTAHVSWYADCFSVYVANATTKDDEFWM